MIGVDPSIRDILWRLAQLGGGDCLAEDGSKSNLRERLLKRRLATQLMLALETAETTSAIMSLEAQTGPVLALEGRERTDALRELAPLYQRRLQQLQAVATALGHVSLRSLYASLLDLDPSALARPAAALIRATDGEFQAIAATAAPGGRLNQALLARAVAPSGYDHLFPALDHERLLRLSLDSLGLDSNLLACVTIDREPRPGKIPRAFYVAPEVRVICPRRPAYRRRVQRALMCQADGPESWRALDPDLTCCHYFGGWMTAAGLRAGLNSRFGGLWHCHREAGTLLIRLWRLGGSLTPVTALRAAGATLDVTHLIGELVPRTTSTLEGGST